jgi:carboxylesterase type B
MKLFLLIIWSIFIHETQSVVFAPTVSTKNGKVRGIVKETDNGSHVNLYYGIPYGKPPTGKLRFGKSEPAANWEGVYDATKIRFACMQQNRFGLVLL